MYQDRQDSRRHDLSKEREVGIISLIDIKGKRAGGLRRQWLVGFIVSCMDKMAVGSW